MKKLFLDDVRQPLDCSKYMHARIGRDNVIYTNSDWVIVRDYNSFSNYLASMGLPDIVSFDHDLAEGHYHESMYSGGKVYMKYLETISEKTGNDCAKLLVEYCMINRAELPICYIHSMNPVGVENIRNTLADYNTWREKINQ